jgi:tetratricopeptide (TPR) repeat protein
MIDFLGIGAQKSGTTWLIKNLKRRPDVWTPRRIKELHYFDLLYLYEHNVFSLNEYKKRIKLIIKNYKRDPNIWVPKRTRALHYLNMLFFSHSKASRLSKFQKRIEEYYDPAKRELSEQEGEYFNRLLDSKFAFTDEWYAHIFGASTGKIKGEFTPSYCAIGEEGAAHVRRLMPEVKLIYMIRDPYERAISSLRMLMERDLKRKRTPADLARDPVFVGKGDYANNITVWETAFDAGQILYIPFGRVKSDPMGVLRDVEAYLGLEPFDKYPVVAGKVNATGKKKVEIPAEVSDQIRSMTEPQYRYLADRFGEAFLAEIC